MQSNESQSGSRKFNLREPLFCYGGHIYELSQHMENFVKLRHFQEVDVNQSPFT